MAVGMPRGWARWVAAGIAAGAVLVGAATRRGGQPSRKPATLAPLAVTALEPTASPTSDVAAEVQSSGQAAAVQQRDAAGHRETKSLKRYVARFSSRFAIFAGILGLFHLDWFWWVPASLVVAYVIGLVYEPHDLPWRSRLRLDSRARKLIFAVVATSMVIAFAVGFLLRGPLISKTHIQLPNLGVAVAGRATTPTATADPGIQFTSGALDVPQADGGHVLVTSEDWNTITAKSKVPKNVTVVIDPDVHPTAVTKNRFQYLADIVGFDPSRSFHPLGIAGAASGNDYVDIVALVNASDHPIEITKLTQTVSLNDQTVICQGTFYSDQATYLTIPARTTYLARLTSAFKPGAESILKGLPNSGRSSTTFSFSWDAV